MAELPRGTVAFLFTDIADSTRLWQQYREAMERAYERHDALLRTAITAHRGVVYKVIGDALQVAFPAAPEAVAAALQAQRALVAEDWAICGPPEPLCIRIALHVGDVDPDPDGDYRSPVLNRLGRLLSAGHGGQILLSVGAAFLARDRLPLEASLRDLGPHRLKDLLEPEPIFQLLHPELPSAFPPLLTLERRPHNLPLQPTPFLGREREVAQVVDLLHRPDVRLLTLTGPGGTGKTRLGLQTAAEVLEDFPDGVFFVPLAPLTDPGLVPSAIAEALGVREEGGQPLQERLRDFMGSKQLLLMLDNVEHLVEAAPLVGELLGAAPGLTVVATSRIPLRLRAEREYAVPTLTLPRRKPPPTLEQMTQFEAVRLFIDRAQAVKSDFIVSNENAPAVAEICHRLDGLPLAIELAAARIRMLSPQAMLTRLEQRLPMLTGGARDAPARQQTLRNAIAWSYDLLGQEEQALFRRLAVFAGGASFEAVEAIANPDGGLDVFSGLERLVEHSLVRQAEGTEGEPRFTMLETIREYGLEQLEISGEALKTRRQHADLFLMLGEEAEPYLTGHEQQRWLERLDAEHDNIRLALAWTAEHDPETALRIAGALWRFWWYRGHPGEGRGILDRLFQHREAVAPAILAKAFDAASGLTWVQGDLQAAQRLAEESLALYRTLGDKQGIANALQGLAVSYGDAGDSVRAMSALEEELALRRELRDRRGAGIVLGNLGEVARAAGDSARARNYYEEALADLRAVGDRSGSAQALVTLGLLDLQDGDLHAAAQIVEALRIWEDLGDQIGVSMAFDHVALLAEKIGEAITAARLLGASQAIREMTGAAFQEAERIWYDPLVTAVQSTLGDQAFDAAWNAGRCLIPFHGFDDRDVTAAIHQG